MNYENESTFDEFLKELQEITKKKATQWWTIIHMGKEQNASHSDNNLKTKIIKVYEDSITEILEQKFLLLKSAIMDIVSELKYKPNDNFEKMVISTDDSIFPVTYGNMKKLDRFYQSLQRQYSDIKDEIAVLKERIKYLWEILSEELQACDLFLQTHTGINIETLQALKEEVKRCEALKTANIEVFVKRRRDELVTLWDQCHCAEEERDRFDYFRTSLYTEDLLHVHDTEIEKLKNYYASNSDLFHLLERRDELWEKMLEVEERAIAPDRYKNRGGQLLKEEKERNAFSKGIPKIEEQLLGLARDYENKVGKPFSSWGKTIDSIIHESHQHHDEDKKNKLSARKNRDRAITPEKSPTPCTSVQKVIRVTPSVHSVKRKTPTPLSSSKCRKVLGNDNDNVPQTAPPKLLVNGNVPGRSRYSIERAKRIEKCRRISLRAAQKKRAWIRKIQVVRTEFKVMRLESFKARWIGSGNTLLQSQRSPSIDSTDDDARIRLDDPSLRLHIAESPSPQSDPSELTFGDACTNPKDKADLDPNMNSTHSPLDAHQCLQQV